jgi:hypothetical protein
MEGRFFDEALVWMLRTIPKCRHSEKDEQANLFRSFLILVELPGTAPGSER